MHICQGSQNFPKLINKPVVALGNFDGVHIGHRRLIEKTIGEAEKSGGTSVVYTFDPHPVKILAPDECPPLIQTLKQRVDTFENLGLDYCVVEKFTQEFARQTAESFFETIILNRLHASAIVVGYDFTFGFHRHGTGKLLENLGSLHNVDVHVLDAQFFDETLVSSTNIRNLVMEGKVLAAGKLLGRCYSITGRVVKGRGIGKTLGAHTANIESENELVPKNGIYLTLTASGKNRHISVTSIGINPTFLNAPFSIETHLIDADINLLGQTITIEFLDFIRDQKAFDSQEELREQIKRDIKLARMLHKKKEI